MTVYLDHNATSHMFPEVIQTMRPYLDDKFGNASCLYNLGVESSYAIEKARIQTARLINANENEIVFTSGGTESDNMALISAVLSTGKKHIVTSAIEHPAIFRTCEFLEEYMDCAVTYLPVSGQGFVDPADVEKAIRQETAIVSIMAANNETGSIQPIREIASICQRKTVLFHTDAVQAAGRIPSDVREWTIDFLSLSGHKMHGPKGIGILYIRDGAPLVPLIHGGGQESGRRAGTENVPAIVGLGKAAELAKNGLNHRAEQLAGLTDYLWEKLAALPIGIQRNSPETNCLPGTLNVSIPGIHGREFVRAMDEEGFCIATGSACSTGKTTPSHVLKAMEKSDEEAVSSIRISLGRGNTREEVDRFVLAVLLVSGFERF